MQFIYKHPLSALIIIIYIFTFLFAKGWAESGAAGIDSVAILIFLFFIYLAANLVWKQYFRNENRRFSNQAINFASHKISKQVKVLASYSLILLVSLVLGEIAATILLYGPNKLLSVGFPYPVFSFVVGRFLFMGFLYNILFYSLVVLLLFYVLKHKGRRL